VERVSYFRKYLRIYYELKGLLLASIKVLLEGEIDSYIARYKEVLKVEKSKPAKTLSNKGLNIYIRVGSFNIAARI
jgi:cbb3-type cytochrome oxidase cytochrome c subunit